MALLIGDNFSYNGKKPNFERDSFETLAALKAFAEANIDNGHIAYCVETNKHYIFNDSNSDDTTTGKWRVLESEFSNKVDQSDLTTQLATKEDKFTVGTCLEMTPERVLNVTLDTTVFKVVASLPAQPASGDEQKIHLVPAESTGTQNIYNEYVWVNNAWELLGKYQSEVDLTPYLTKTDAQSTYQPIGNYATKEEVEEVSESIPSLNGYATETWVENKNYLTEVPIASENTLGGIKVGAGLSITGDGILSATGGGVADSVAWENVVGRPTNLSQFINDSGFITSDDLPDLSDYALKSEIPDISNLATKTELAGYLPLTGGTLTGGSLFLKESGAGIFYVEQAGIGIKSTNNGDDSISIMGGGVVLELTSPSHFTIDDAQILTENNWGTYITVTDTKNTTGTSNSTSKLYLVGGTSQSSTGVVTYSNTSVYTQSGQLYATRMNATSGFYETSDGTLKNIKSELNIADNIDKIPTVLFSWKKDESEDINQDVPVHVGTIAQDIQKIYPDLVAEDAEGHLTVDYAKLSVIAIAAIKELKKEIEILKSKIN